MKENNVKQVLNLANEHAKALEKVLEKLYAHYHDEWERFNAETSEDEEKEIELWETWYGFAQILNEFGVLRRVLKGNHKEILNKVKQFVR